MLLRTKCESDSTKPPDARSQGLALFVCNIKKAKIEFLFFRYDSYFGFV